jgi:oxepin-CoA hydrolase/3-oxo-5,6-dehydrosuberyl-CoA semialdehyde dehydrogenase
MVAIPFDVNDENLRKKFFDRLFTDCVEGLAENTPPLWGKMTPQHMIEHLIWSFEGCTGIIEFPCRTPDNLFERAKRFLHNNNATPHEYKNPLIGEGLLPLRFSRFTDAKEALHKVIGCFADHFRERPGAIHTHPVFGPLGADEWHRSQFKHCYHHLLQFGLINQMETASS